MTGPLATDAIERWLATFAPANRCGLGLLGLALGTSAAFAFARRLVPASPVAIAPPPRSRSLPEFLRRFTEGPPRSFRLELLPALFLVFAGASYVATRLFATAGGPTAHASFDLRANGRALLLVAAVIVTFLALWTRLLGDGLADVGVTARALVPTLLGTLAFYVLWFPAQIGAGALESGLFELLHRPLPMQAAGLAFATDRSLRADPIVLGAIVLAAPIYEELLYRGVILRYLQRVVPMAAAVVVDAALFTSVHSGGYSAVFVLGTGLAWLMARTRSIAAPICFHVVHNGLTLLLIAAGAG